MKLHSTEVEGCFIIEKKYHEDERGLLMESFRFDEFAIAGLPSKWNQENTVFSYPGVIRGLHIQKQHEQGKLVNCMLGDIRDVCVDVRKNSKTFGRKVIYDLNPNDGRMIYIPEGCLHGFSVIGEIPALVNYKMTHTYMPELQRGVAYNDPDLDIPWGVGTAIVSDRDQNLPKLADYLKSLN